MATLDGEPTTRLTGTERPSIGGRTDAIRLFGDAETTNHSSGVPHRQLGQMLYIMSFLT
jgi:hypothetical protein